MNARTLHLDDIRPNAFAEQAVFTVGETLRTAWDSLIAARSFRRIGAHDGEDGSSEHLRRMAVEFAASQRVTV